MAQTNAATEVERIEYYRNLAAQFRGWAEDETNQEARDRLFEMAREYERLTSPAAPKISGVVRPESAEKHRDEAARLRSEATKTTHPEDRQQLLDIAALYDRLAAAIARLLQSN
jgi:hypothetical protein